MGENEMRALRPITRNSSADNRANSTPHYYALARRLEDNGRVSMEADTLQRLKSVDGRDHERIFERE